jgi:hypothetical protein
MKTTALLLSVLSAVTAAPLEARQTPTEFQITNFSANTTPHGTGAFFSYNINVPGVLSTSCSYSDQTSVGRLPTVEFTPCADPAVQWQFRQDPGQPGAEGRYRIVITVANSAGGRNAGFREWAPTVFPVEDFGSSVAQFYRGETDFVISDIQ